MKQTLLRVLFFVVIVATTMLIILFVASVSQAAECLPNARAVWTAHPGSWATWNVVDGRKCYSVGKRKGTMRSYSRLRSALIRTMPLPLPRLGYREFKVEESEEVRRESLLSIIHDAFMDEAPLGNRFDEIFRATTGIP